MTASIKAYSEHLPWFIPDGNSSYQPTKEASPRLDINTENPGTLKKYMEELPIVHTGDHTNYSSEIWAGSKVVVVARVGDYDNDTRGEWEIITEPNKRNETLSNNEKYVYKNHTESSDYFLGNDDVQKYLKDYQDLLYTFKDFVKIGATPSMRKNISQYNSANKNNEKIFNVTYVMPIPKTKKYFEIKLSNLTKTQYNEINALLQNHILKKTNSTEISKSTEQEIVYVDENTKGNIFISHALSDSLSSPSQTSKPILPKSRFTKDLPSENEPIPDYFGPLLTPEGFSYFLNNFDSIHMNLNNKSFDQNIFQPGTSNPTLIQNNGFHAEIATDYGENNAQEGYNQTNDSTKNFSGSNYKELGSGRTILNPYSRRNRTKLFSQTRLKRPIINAPDNVLNTRNRKLSLTSVSEQPIPTVSSTLPPNPSNTNLKSNFDWINISSDPMVDEPLEIASINVSQISINKDSKIPEQNSTVSISAQDLIEIYKLYNSSSTKPITPVLYSNTSQNISNELFRKAADKIPKPLHVMEAAEWLIDMKRKMDEEERKKTERYKSYIKQFLGGDEGSTLLGKGNNGNIMKINKQENILEELKLLMLDYFVSLNFKTQEPISNNTSAAAQSILNATNIFELMEQSSQLVKLNLNMKLKSDTKEPTKFVKQIVEKQVEKCKKILNKGLFIEPQQNSTGSIKKSKSGHRRLMVFTKCMNFKLQRCIKGFSLWLDKGKYFLRPQFKLERAYENYEIERNLYCLRNYNPSSLGSHPHGVRVKPGPTVNRRLGPGKIRARQNKQSLGIKAKKNGQHLRKSARPRIDRPRGYKQQRNSKQRPKVQRYLNQQQGKTIMQQK